MQAPQRWWIRLQRWNFFRRIDQWQCSLIIGAQGWDLGTLANRALHSSRSSQSTWGSERKFFIPLQEPVHLVSMTETEDPQLEKQKRPLYNFRLWSRWVKEDHKSEGTLVLVSSCAFLTFACRLQVRMKRVRSLVIIGCKTILKDFKCIVKKTNFEKQNGY